MDSDRFDALSRSLSLVPSRRGALRLLAGSAFGGLAILRPGAVVAHDALKACKKKSGKQKKKCVKKAKQHNASHTPQSSASCTPNCSGKRCGPNGCGGSCGTCGGVRSCPNGACVCPSDTTPCGETACCRNADEQCCNGTCASSTLVPEGGACLSSGDCCPGST